MENLVFYRSHRESSEIWEAINGSYVKGYAYLDQKLLTGKMILDIIESAVLEKKLDSVLPLLNGHFGAILQHDSCVILISDKIRSFPILYTVREDRIYCADSGESAKQIFRNCTMNIDAEIEFSALGYLSGGDTLVNDLYYVPAGEYISIDRQGNPKRKKYFSFSLSHKMLDENDLFRISKIKLEESFARSISSLGSYSSILIPLSGGYDSRLIACLCKAAGLKKVICFTYGKQDSFEVKTSKMVAEALGYEWIFVEYNKDVWDKTLNSEEFKDYFIFSGCLTSTPHFQDFPALMQLKEKGVINKDTVVIPGHCGDVLGGSKIPVEVIENGKKIYQGKDIVDYIYSHLYDLNKLQDKYRDIEKKRISTILMLEDNAVYDVDRALDIYECEWIIKTRIANFIINSVRAYEFIGVRWRLPLWDLAYASIWYQLLWRIKYNSSLYNSFLFENYFKVYNVAFLKSKTSVGKVVKDLMKKTLPINLKMAYRKRVASILSNNSHSNFNGFEYVIDHMEKQLNKAPLYYIQCYNHGNINAPTSLIYLQSVKKELQ